MRRTTCSRTACNAADLRSKTESPNWRSGKKPNWRGTPPPPPRDAGQGKVQEQRAQLVIRAGPRQRPKVGGRSGDLAKHSQSC